MKFLIPAVALFVVSLSSSMRAESPSQKSSMEQLAKAVAIAYENQNLGILDAQQSYVDKIEITIKHSLGGDGDRPNSKTFSRWAAGEQWLKSKAREAAGSYRAVKPLVGCQKGLCTFNFKDGILHNHLYLKEIRYGVAKGDRPYLKSILLLDGD
jgi:hypothetical protein